MSTASCIHRHTAFADFLAQGKTGTEAARSAGFTGTADALAVTASRLLRNAKVQDLIKEAQLKSSSERIMTARRVKELWTEIAEGTLRCPMVTEDGRVVEILPTMSDRLKALEGLARALGMFINREVSDGKLEITIRRGADAPAALKR